MDRHLFLIGGRASGKTSVARLVAGRLGTDVLDTDHLAEERAGESIASLVARAGWEAFRDLESGVLEQLLAGPPLVVACGGGMVLREKNRELLRAGHVVYLRADPAVLAARLQADPLHRQRPSLTGKSIEQEVAEVMAEREPLYQAAAHAVVSCDAPLEQVADAVLAVLNGQRKR